MALETLDIHEKDVCNIGDLPEVEILSLIEEQIPKYRLRADTITDFCGYENQDWIQTPLIPIDEDLELTNNQIHETLKYFVLCSDRVTQMTKTYNDIEAVNRLLEEKERDLELAAKIGQTLLTKNQELTDKNDNLEEQVLQLTEKVNQIKHELLMKDGLLQAFTENLDTSPSEESRGSTDSLHHLGACTLQKKIQDLQDENLKLRLETELLSSETSQYEDKEQKLVDDCVSQLSCVKKELEFLSEELLKKTEECSSQKEEVTSLLAQVCDLQKRVKTVTLENVELHKHLEASQTAQRELTTELAELKDKHDELCMLYEKAQEEIRELRRKQKPGAVRHNYMSASLLSLPTDSLASELESSLRSECDYPRGFSPSERKVHNWKIFETAKAAKRGAASTRSSAASSVMNLGHSASNYSSHDVSHNDSGESGSVSTRSSMYFADYEGSEAPTDDLTGLGSLYKGDKRQYGRPGIPGSNDLETALRKLSIRRANELNEQDFQEDEKRRKERQRLESETTDTPGSCRTPDSTLSTGSGLSQFSLTGNNNPYYRMPQKLRIIKPLEGSVTLRQWQQLATPKMDNLFDTRPGVATKGERKLDVEVESYSLSDFEEDDDYQECPSKRYDESLTINTITDSKVKHPSEHNSDEDTMSECEMSDSSITPQTSTPRMATGFQGNTDATSTFSMSLGLASILNERDLVPSTNKKNTSKSDSNGNPERLDSIVSDSHFDMSKIKMSSIYSTTTSSDVKISPSNSFDHPKDSLKQGTHILVDKLKIAGISVFNSEYLGGFWGKKAESTAATTATDSDTSNGHVIVGQVPDTEKSSVSSLLKQAWPGGVKGALTHLHKNGLL